MGGYWKVVKLSYDEKSFFYSYLPPKAAANFFRFWTQKVFIFFISWGWGSDLTTSNCYSGENGWPVGGGNCPKFSDNSRVLSTFFDRNTLKMDNSQSSKTANFLGFSRIYKGNFYTDWELAIFGSFLNGQFPPRMDNSWELSTCLRGWTIPKNRTIPPYVIYV